MIPIQKYLPHQPPMQMVDSIISITKTDIITQFLVTENNIFVSENIFSEAGLIENMAQSCSAIVGQFYFLEQKENTKVIGYIGSIKKMEIFSLPKIGQNIQTKAQLLSNIETENFSMTSLSCETFWQEKQLAKAQINLFIQEIK
ncbi:MAG: acyl carrier protein [Capnocytophaga sp.]|nr:acyl carrier protein [Capnocytophaga sp.]